MTYFKPGNKHGRIADGLQSDPFFAGQQAYWRTEPRHYPLKRADAAVIEKWLAGWDAGAMEAARVLRQTRAVQAYAKTVRDTLHDAGLLLRRIDGEWARKPPGFKGAIAASRVAINNCLVHIPDLEAAASPDRVLDQPNTPETVDADGDLA